MIEVPRIAGVRLDQYAGICVALTEGFSLPDALANDSLDRSIWLRAAPAWAARLAREKPGGPMQASYTKKLGEATAWLGRRVTPIEDDIESWLGFLGAWCADPDPSALLARLALRSVDVSRIQRSWAERVDADAALRERVMKIAARRPAGLPSIQVVPATLRPFPWSTRHVPSAEPVLRSGEGTADTAADVPCIQIVKPSFLLEPTARTVPVSGHVQPASAPAAPPRIGETMDAFELPRGPAMPFSPAPHPTRASTPIEKSAPVKGETVDAFELPRCLMMPFTPVPAGAPRALPARAAEPSRAPSPRIGETVDTVELPCAPALPFAAKGYESAAKQAPPSPATKPAIGETVMAFELPARLVLPFGGPRAQVSAPGAVTPSVPSTPEPAGAPIVPARSAPDEAGSRAAPSADEPVLTLEQHASLVAELAMFPTHTALVLRRYRVSPEVKASLDRHYAGLAAASPDVRAAWDRACRAYSLWLLSASRRDV